MDIHIAMQLYTHITNLDTKISYVLQLSQDMQFGSSNVITKLMLHPCTIQFMTYANAYFYLIFAQQHLVFTFNLGIINHAMHFPQKLLINALMKQHPSTQLASYGVYVQLYYSYLATQLVCYKSCMLRHQQKSGYVPAMVAQLVFAVLRASYDTCKCITMKN